MQGLDHYYQWDCEKCADSSCERLKSRIYELKDIKVKSLIENEGSRTMYSFVNKILFALGLIFAAAAVITLISPVSLLVPSLCGVATLVSFLGSFLFFSCAKKTARERPSLIDKYDEPIKLLEQELKQRKDILMLHLMSHKIQKGEATQMEIEYYKENFAKVGSINDHK